MPPKISICVPNLNTRPFLEERFRTIADQSLHDWELLVYDSHSTDGAWEYIQELAAREPRMRAWQGPREGTPGSWSPCVREARGEYVYIATSDDTMPPDCLEKLVAALDAHPECDLAHCPLKAVDENGRELARTREWYLGSMFVESSGALFSRPHIRRAPFDGLLHLLGGSVYVSITQLLVRRSLFERIGPFRSTWGSIGDFNWSMRAGLVANTIHVPDTWGGWRLHSSQATAGIALASPEHAGRIDAMIEDAIAGCAEFLPLAIRQRLASDWLRDAREMRTLRREIGRRSRDTMLQRRAYLAGRLLEGSAAAREHLGASVLGRPQAHWVQRRLDGVGAGPSLVPIAAAGPGRPATHAHPLVSQS